jgi:hypothetical protein
VINRGVFHALRRISVLLDTYKLSTLDNTGSRPEYGEKLPSDKTVSKKASIFSQK